MIAGLDEPALLIKRFDRGADGRIHFEEFNQLLMRSSRTKYEGAHKDMAEFILHTEGCLPTQAYLLYRRILAGFLLGNTDMHLKNFAMFHTQEVTPFKLTNGMIFGSCDCKGERSVVVKRGRDLIVRWR